MRYCPPKIFNPIRAVFDLRVWKNQEGVAAIEFAMIMPIMFMLFVGAVEFSQAITVDRRVTQVASSTADLIARSKEITTSEIDGIMLIINELVKPYDPNPLKLTVSTVIADPNDATATTVCWSYNHNSGVTNYSNGQSFALPSGIVEAGGSVIVAEVEYNYTPLIFNYFITTTKKLEETFYLKPRLSSSIEYNGTKCL